MATFLWDFHKKLPNRTEKLKNQERKNVYLNVKQEVSTFKRFALVSLFITVPAIPSPL